MSNRVALQPAFIMHRRPFRETSVLLEVFTRYYGRIALVAKGVRAAKSKLRPILQPFSPLLLSWQGKTELMSLVAAEPMGQPIFLQGDCLAAGFYLNELILSVFQKQDPHPNLFDHYQLTLNQLTQGILDQTILRLFEKKLLEEAGYGLPFQQVQADQYYQFCKETGLAICDPNGMTDEKIIFSGKNLLAIFAENFTDQAVLKDSKRLLRFALAALLGTKTIQSRKLLWEMK
ncbi:MAG: DNA repair protein RecO [Gammaproteobacteria bacterium]|nr:DNA repair protein RecO [Gammaproteobacteria bacterium]